MSNQKLAKIIWAFFLPGILLAHPQVSLSQPTVFSLFFQENVPNVAMQFDFDLLVEQKDSSHYFPAKIEIHDSAGNVKTLPIEVKAKGHARRKICDIPPLKIKFSKETLTEQGLDPEIQTLEWVLLCSDDAASEQYVLREYAAYRLYNLLTDRSFRAQLVMLQIKRANGKPAFQKAYAIVLENEDELAARLGGQILERERMSKTALKPDDFDRFCLFQYLIANTDWAVFNGHNMAFVGFSGDSLLLPVPFDFDYAGIVETPYAVPHSKYPIHSVTERLFLGPCRSPEKMLENVQHFRGRKTEMLRFCSEFQYWNKGSRRHVLRFVESFFEILDDSERLRSQILEHCDFKPGTIKK